MKIGRCTFPVFIALLLGSAPVEGRSKADSPSALVSVGALTCEARRVTPDASATLLDCGLRFDLGIKAAYTGEMHGKGLYLVHPGEIHVVWRVLAKDPSIAPEALVGVYSTSSNHAYPFVRNNSNVLVGGKEAAVVLELLAPRVDAIGSDTHLSLRLLER
jgi:Protein of unknown function (DUF992)